VLFTYELARRLPLQANVTVNALHPGVVQTELSRHALLFLCLLQLEGRECAVPWEQGWLEARSACCACRYLIGESPPWWQQPLLRAAALFLKTPAQGAATSIFLASSPQVEGVGAKYWVDCKPQASSKASYDAVAAARLWEVSQELTGADAALPVLA
jgi:retinol dehydrogenase-14